MPSESIERYRRIASEMIQAIEADDEAEVRRIDRELEAAFNSLIDARPRTPEETEMFISFLLELLVSEDSRTPFQEQVCDKVRSLSTLVARA